MTQHRIESVVLDPDEVRTVNCAYLLALAKLDMHGVSETQREHHKKRLALAIMESTKEVELNAIALADAAFKRLQGTSPES